MSFRFSAALIGGLLLGGSAGALYAAHDLWRQLPDVKVLENYRPALPLRIYANDGELLAEFGEERREFVSIEQIPESLRLALLSIEDASFYEHNGVQLGGIVRAALTNILSGERAQGASTITMQVARNFFLSRTKTYGRKISEVLLAYKLEQAFSKDKLLELYMNKVYLGERTYGFAAAASVYFGKGIQDLTLGEAAMLAGLPKGPSIYNPIVNLERATSRQHYILQRMRSLGHISEEQYEQAIAEQLHVKTKTTAVQPYAAFATELARRLVVDHFGADAYSMGLDVITTIGPREQQAATQALRTGLIRTQNSQGYAGPETQAGHSIDVGDPRTVASVLAPFSDKIPMQAAIVSHASQSKDLEAVLRDGRIVRIPTSRMPAGARQFLAPNSPAPLRLQHGAVIWVQQDATKKTWSLTQRPKMEGALVSLDSKSGDIIALAGGFDFQRSNFDHVTQAERQPGSTFKPFVFSAALEKGLFPGTFVNDERRVVVPKGPGQVAWEPKNSPARYDGFITEREGLEKSKNVVAVNVMEAAGAQFVHDYVARFGFAMDRGHEGLTLALGSKPVTPLELARAYSVFANGGQLVHPKIISRVSERDGEVIFDEKEESQQPNIAITQRNAFVVDSLLQSVVRNGSGHRAASLGRADVAGKTGTSNDAKDAWFSGYSSGLTTVAWVGYDQPKSLGHVAGGTVALPIWLDFMNVALSGKQPRISSMPGDLTKLDDDLIYPEYLAGRCIMPPDYINTPFRCGNDGADSQPNGRTTESENVANLVEQREQISQLFSQ